MSLPSPLQPPQIPLPAVPSTTAAELHHHHHQHPLQQPPSPLSPPRKVRESQESRDSRQQERGRRRREDSGFVGDFPPDKTQVQQHVEYQRQPRERSLGPGPQGRRSGQQQQQQQVVQVQLQQAFYEPSQHTHYNQSQSLPPTPIEPTPTTKVLLAQQQQQQQQRNGRPYENGFSAVSLDALIEDLEGTILSLEGAGGENRGREPRARGQPQYQQQYQQQYYEPTQQYHEPAHQPQQQYYDPAQYQQQQQQQQQRPHRTPAGPRGAPPSSAPPPPPPSGRNSHEAHNHPHQAPAAATNGYPTRVHHTRQNSTTTSTVSSTSATNPINNTDIAVHPSPPSTPPLSTSPFATATFFTPTKTLATLSTLSYARSGCMFKHTPGGIFSSKPTWKDRFYVLASTHLYLFKSETGTQPAGIYLQLSESSTVCVSEMGIGVLEVSGREYATLESGETAPTDALPTTWILQCASQDDMMAWLAALRWTVAHVGGIRARAEEEEAAYVRAREEREEKRRREIARRIEEMGKVKMGKGGTPFASLPTY